MRYRRRPLVVELTPTSLSISDGVRARYRVIQLPEEAASWAASIASLGPSVSTLHKELGSGVRSAVVIFHSPSTAIGVFACPRRAGPAAAFDAALLGLSEASALPVAELPHDVQLLSRDPGVGSPEAPSMTHLLAAAESESLLESLAAMARSAGLEPRAIVPLPALAMRSAGRRALASSASGCSLCLHIGIHHSVVAAADRNRLVFVRQLGVGLHTLVAALSHGSTGGAEAGASLDATAALDLLLSAGIPRGGGSTGANGAERVLPLVQPGIQRLVVETRQSIRFGLSEEARRGARITIEGAGALVPRLAELIAQQVGLPLAGVEATRVESDPRLCATGAALLPADGRGVPSLLPGSLAMSESATRVRRGLSIGTAAALAVIGVDLVGVRSGVAKVERELTQVRADAARLGPVAELHDSITRATAALASVRARAESAMGPEPHWHAAMVMVSEAVPDSVRLGQMSFLIEAGVPTIRVSGQTLAGEGGEGSATLRQLLSRLSAAPMVGQARLGATQLIEARWGTSQSFDLSVSLVALPSASLARASAEEGKP